jgi:hypothetical protein
VVNIHLGASLSLFGIPIFSKNVKCGTVCCHISTRNRYLKDIGKYLLQINYKLGKQTRKTKNLEDEKAQIKIT